MNRVYANFGKAIAAYERRLVSNAFDPSPFDRFMAGDEEAMSPAAIRGARLFIGHAGCAECHRGPMFTDYAFHNIGVPQTGQYVPATDTGRFDGIGKLVTTDPTSSSSTGRASSATTRTPRISLTLRSDGARLGDGAVQDADAAQRQQDRPLHARRRVPDAVGRREPLQLRRRDRATMRARRDPAIAPLMLTNAELGDLVEFLRALDGRRRCSPSVDPDAARRAPLLDRAYRRRSTRALAQRSQVARGLLEDGDRGGRAAGQQRIVEVDREQAEAAARSRATTRSCRSATSSR